MPDFAAMNARRLRSEMWARHGKWAFLAAGVVIGAIGWVM